MKKIIIKSKSDQYKIVLFVVSIVFVLYGFYTWVYEPQWKDIDALQAQCSAKQQKIDVLTKYQTEHPDPAKHMAEIEAKIAAVNKQFPPEIEISGYVQQLDRMAVESGVKLLGVKPAEPVNKTEYREIPVEVNVKGPYYSFINFLKKLEKTERYNTVASLGISLKNGELEGKLSTKIFSYGISADAALNANKTASNTANSNNTNNGR